MFIQKGSFTIALCLDYNEDVVFLMRNNDERLGDDFLPLAVDVSLPPVPKGMNRLAHTEIGDFTIHEDYSATPLF